jgi:hypothetical protein
VPVDRRIARMVARARAGGHHNAIGNPVAHASVILMTAQ